jgi:hypothetical protein
MSRQRRLRYRTLWNPAPTRAEALRTLGLSGDASDVDVKKAWRRIAVATHPDTHPDDAAAEARFKAAAEAYEVLTEKEPAAALPAEGTREERLRRMQAEHLERVKARARGQSRVHVPPEFTTKAAGPAVDWASIFPDIAIVLGHPFIGVLKDGKAELYVNDTYKTTSPSLAAVVYFLIDFIQAQPGTRKRDWEGYSTYIGHEEPPHLYSVPLRDLAERVNLGTSGDSPLPPHAPPTRSGSMDPSDFS